MAETIRQNFVVHDVVQHIYEEDYYRPKHSFFYSVRKMARQVRLYLIIIVLSCGVGYLAVQLSGMTGTGNTGTGSGLPLGLSASQVKSFVNSKDLDDATINELKSKLDNLSDSEKRSLMKQFGGK